MTGSIARRASSSATRRCRRRVVVDDDQLAVDAGAVVGARTPRAPDRAAGRARCRWAPRSQARGLWRCGGQGMRLASTIIQRSTRLSTDVHTPVPGARRRAAARCACRRSCSRWGRPGALRLRRRAHPARRAALSRRLGSEAAGDPLTSTRRCAPSGRGDAVVAAADLAAAALVAAAAARLGTRLGRPRPAGRRRCCSCCCRTRRSRGSAASGCARSARRSSRVAVTAARCCCCCAGARRAVERRPCGRSRPACCFGIGLLAQVQRRVYAVAGTRRGVADAAADRRRACCASPPGSWSRSSALLAVFGVGGALGDLYEATIALQPAVLGRDLRRARRHRCATCSPFPIERARVDALWFAGRRRLLSCCWRGAFSQRDAARPASSGSQRRACRSRSTAAAACRSTSSRRSRRWRWPPAGGGGLDLAAAGSLGRRSRIAAVPLAAAGRDRRRGASNPFPKLAEQTSSTPRYALGRIDRRRLPRPLRRRPASTRRWRRRRSASTCGAQRRRRRVYVFGFTCAAYVYGGPRAAPRASSGAGR